MLRIMVVEDEPPILRSICNKIMKACPSCEIVHRATNGQDAVNYLKENSVDIVFTDINMPLMNGLELLAYIRKYDATIHTIILSGYQEFDYARKAVTLGAYDYLLKPLELEELQKILKKIQYGQYKQMITAVLQGEMIEEALPRIQMKEGFCFVSLCVGAFPVKGIPNNMKYANYWEKVDLEGVLQQMDVCPSNYFVVSSRYRVEKMIVFKGMSDNRLKLVLRELVACLQQNGAPLTCIKSSEIKTDEGLYESYRGLVRVLPRMIVFGESSMQDLSGAVIGQEYFISNEQEKKVLYALEKKQIALFRQEMYHIADELKPLHLSQINLETLLIHVVLLCKKTHFIKSNVYDLEMKMYEALLQTDNYEELFEKVIEAILEEQSEQSVTETSDKIGLVRQIENFIIDHMGEAVTNQVLSEHFGLVPGYISRLFKAHKGVSPSEYVLLLRIEKAKEMLKREQNLLAKDVAELVGYSDPLYFSRVFKKVTGMYPSEYRKHIEAVKEA